MTKKFGRLPESITKRLHEIDSVEDFYPYVERVVVVDSLADMGFDD